VLRDRRRALRLEGAQSAAALDARGDKLVGWGMATATYPTNRSPAQCAAACMPDGTAVFRSSTQDLGTGTYTVMTQVAADALGVPVERVRFELGDSRCRKRPCRAAR
jgi:xanthine dehydrogenase YagR molybdenum-binding subunit